MSLSPEEFVALVEAYGTDLQRWPVVDEVAVERLRRHPQCRQAWQDAQTLDSVLDAHALPAFEALEARLLQQALPGRPAGLFERLFSWLTPPMSEPGLMPWWRPLALASVPLMLGLFIGSQYDPAIDYGQALSLEEELYFISFSDYAEVM